MYKIGANCCKSITSKKSSTNSIYSDTQVPTIVCAACNHHQVVADLIFLVLFVLVMTGFETENKYLVRNTLGQQVYFAAESEYGFLFSL